MQSPGTLIAEIEQLRSRIKTTREALTYIVQHAGFSDKPKWAAEFVDVATQALDATEEK